MKISKFYLLMTSIILMVSLTIIGVSFVMTGNNVGCIDCVSSKGWPIVFLKSGGFPTPGIPDDQFYFDKFLQEILFWFVITGIIIYIPFISVQKLFSKRNRKSKS